VKFRQVGQTVVIIVIVAIATIGLALVFAPRPQPPLRPSPNGYDDLLAVAPLVIPNHGDWRTQSIAELRAVFSANSNSVATIRDALRKDWAVPISYDTNYTFARISNLTASKVLAQLLRTEGEVAKLERRTNEALGVFTDCIRLGQKYTHGSLMLEDLVGIACKAIGMEAAETIWRSADDVSLQIFLKRLAEIDTSNQSPAEVIRREREWARGTHGPLQYAWISLFLRSTLQQSEERLRARHLRDEAEVRLLRTAVAMELFRRKMGRYPGKLGELIPEYLESVPADPFTGKSLFYRPTTNSYLLYSVGADRKDDGGTPFTRGSRTFEINGIEVEPGDLISTPPPNR